MTFRITQATKTDAQSLSEVFFAAFSDPFNRTMFPPTPDVRAWVIEHLFSGDGQNENEIFLIVTDSSHPDAPVAFAKWISRVDAADRDGLDTEGPAWPVSSDPELCEQFFGMMDEHHHRLMGDRPHYCVFPPLAPCLKRCFASQHNYHQDFFGAGQLTCTDLDLLAVHPSFQGRGLASKLLRWGLECADEEGVEVFLTSSPDGRRLYEKYGFEIKDSFSPFPGYEYRSMIRPVQG